MKPAFEIDPAFAAYMFQADQLADDELEQTLLAEGGPRDKLLVAKLPEGLYLMDGHRRYRICQKHSLPYETDVIAFKTREAAFDFMDRLALARRNLNSNQLSILRARVAKRRENDIGATTARSDVAKEHGVSERTVFRDTKYANAVERLAPEIREQVIGTFSQAKAIELAKLEPAAQMAAVKAKQMPEPPPKPEPLPFETAVKEAGRMVAQLQNKLADVNDAKPDPLRLKSSKSRAKEIGRLLDKWGTEGGA